MSVRKISKGFCFCDDLSSFFPLSTYQAAQRIAVPTGGLDEPKLI